MTITKSDLVLELAEKTGEPKTKVSAILNALTDTIAAHTKEGDTVALIGFGSFVCRDVAERSGKNPQTGEAITIPAHKKVAFKPGKDLKSF